MKTAKVNFIQLLVEAFSSLNNKITSLNKSATLFDFDQGEETLHYKFVYTNILGRPSFIICDYEEYGGTFLITASEAKRIVEQKDMETLRDLAGRLECVGDLGNMEIFDEQGNLCNNFFIEYGQMPD